MADNGTGKSNTERKYGLVPKLGGWVITYLDDAGLVSAMSLAGARETTSRKADGMHRYWIVSEDNFANVKTLLDLLGYTPHEQKPVTQTAYRAELVSVAEKTPKPAESQVSTAQTEPVAEPQAGTSKTTVYPIHTINTWFKERIRQYMRAEFWVEGELLEIKQKNGSRYFEIIEQMPEMPGSSTRTKKSGKDDNYRLNCIIWASEWNRLAPVLENDRFSKGNKIHVKGHLDSYNINNSVSLIVNDVDLLFEEGAFYKQKLIIREKLEKMGICYNNRNLPMPYLPLRLALFSNESAAGWGDFINVIYTSMFPFDIQLFEISVQGGGLESSFLREFQRLEKIGFDKFDLALVLRGGGSTQDLYDFNSIKIAECIARCPLKFLIGIGHDKDWTVLDEIATRAATPLAAGTLLVNIINNILGQLDKLSDDLRHYTNQYLERSQTQLRLLREQMRSCAESGLVRAQTQLANYRSDIAQSAKDTLKDRRFDIARMRADIEHLVGSRCSARHSELQQLRQSLAFTVEQGRTNARNQLESYRSQIDSCSGAILRDARADLARLRERLAESAALCQQNAMRRLVQYGELLRLLHPGEILNRGFVSVSDADGHRVRDARRLSAGEHLVINFANGKADVTVENVSVHAAGAESNKDRDET